MLIAIAIISLQHLFLGGIIELIYIWSAKLADMKDEECIVNDIKIYQAHESKSIGKYRNVFLIQLLIRNNDEKIIVRIPEPYNNVEKINNLKNIKQGDLMRVFLSKTTNKIIYQVENITNNTILMHFEDRKEDIIWDNFFLIFFTFFLVFISFLQRYPKFLGKYRRKE
jgi:hypothetical protein